MASMERKNLNAPDERRSFPKGKLELVTLGGITFGRATLEPGWKWSESLKPIAKTASCQAAHTQYHISGRIRVRMDNGEEQEFGPGDVCRSFLLDTTPGFLEATPWWSSISRA